MNNLTAFLVAELPKINENIDKHLKTLHLQVQPIGQHVMNAGGKRVRPALLLLVCRVFSNFDQKQYDLAAAMEFLHAATLLHDDILDHALIRRGRTTAHIVHGEVQTILGGDILFALAIRIIGAQNDLRLIPNLSEAVIQTASGEIQELALLGNPTITENQYFEIIKQKTAYLLQAACELGALISNAPDEMVKAVGKFGLFAGISFQLVDDAIDYTVPPEVSGKPLGGDLREGKYTLPLILWLNSLSESKQQEIKQILANGDLDENFIKDVIKSIQDSNTPMETRKIARQYVEIAKQELKILPDVKERKILEDMADLILLREN